MVDFCGFLILFVIKIFNFFLDFILDIVIYNCLCENTGLGRNKLIVVSVWFWFLLIVMVKVIFKGNCLRFILKGSLEFVGVMSIRCKKIFLLVLVFVIILVSRRWLLIWVICNFVSLYKFSVVLRFFNNIIGVLIFSRKEWLGNFDVLILLRNLGVNIELFLDFVLVGLILFEFR